MFSKKNINRPGLDFKKANLAKKIYSKLGFLKDLWLVFLAIIIVLISNVWLVQSYRVDGVSMQPTLENNDHLLVWKSNRSWASITGGNYIPKRGDIIIFEHPDNQLVLIKRVVGLPGERVTIKNNQIIIHSSEYPDGFLPNLKTPENTNPPPGDQVYGVLKEDELFVVGDNRQPNQSNDSRSFGPIKAENIIGKLVLRVFPFKSWEWFF